MGCTSRVPVQKVPSIMSPGLSFISAEILDTEPRGSHLGPLSHARHELCH